MLLYFLDQHAFPPEPPGMWVAGDGRAEIIVRCEDPIDHLTVTAFSPIQTVFTMSFGAESVTRALEPRQPVTFEVPARGVRGLNSYAYLMTALSSDGFTPAAAGSSLEGQPQSVGPCQFSGRAKDGRTRLRPYAPTWRMLARSTACPRAM